MALQKITGGPVTIPPAWLFNRANNGFSNTGSTLDSASEQQIHTGKLVWADGGTHTISSSGGKIGWKITNLTWATSGSQVTVGIQDISSSAGPPGRGDGTWDVKKVLTQGTDTLTNNTFPLTAMDTGSKTIVTGDDIAIIVEMTTRNGSDAMLVQCSATPAQTNSPSVVNFVSPSTYNAVTGIPNVILIADDGTLGMLEGSFPYLTVGTVMTAWHNASTTKEYGNLFSLPFNCRISGIWACYTPNNNGLSTCDFRLYTDPLNTGAGVTQAASGNAISRSGLAGTNGIVSFFPFATPYDYTANTLMVETVTPTNNTSISASYFETDLNATFGLHPLGTQCYAVSRNTISSGTAFSTFGSDARRLCMGLMISHFDDGAGGGAIIVPNITRNIYLGEAA